MARLFGIEIPNEKRIEASLCYIYGIGPSIAKKVLEQSGVAHAKVSVSDRGALDCVIRARVEAAVLRGKGEA